MVSVIEFLIVGGMFLTMVVVSFLIIRAKVQGKIIVFFIEKDKTISYKMFKPKFRLFTFSKRKEDSETYMIDTEKVM